MLCEPEDEDALWLAATLRRRGVTVEVVLPEEIIFGSTLTSRLDIAGVSSTMRLADGRVLEGQLPQLVVNRLTTLPDVVGPSPGDASYLAEEWRAVIAAWLRALPGPVLNPPRATSLVGPVMATPVWRSIAAAHGVPVRPWRSDRDEEPAHPVEIVSIGGRCIDRTGGVPPDVAKGVGAIARHVGAPLLGVMFDRSPGWELLDATPFPRLRFGGDEVVDAVLACTSGGDA